MTVSTLQADATTEPLDFGSEAAVAVAQEWKAATDAANLGADSILMWLARYELTADHFAAVGGAGIDVYDDEPPPANHPLLNCEQVVFTPHCADMTPEGVDLLNEGAVNNVIAFLEGRPQNDVT